MVRWMALIVFALACQQSPRADLSTQVVGEPIEPPFEVTGEAENLELTWYDAEGPHTAERRSDIPVANRERVRVDSLELPPDQRDAAHVYVADFRQEQDGRYPVTRFPREAFDTLVDDAAPEPEPELIASGDVVIYGASWCNACRRAAAYLTERGVPFEDKDIEREPGARAEMQRKAREAGVQPSGIPVIDFRGTILTGFSQGRIDQLIRDTATHTL